MNDKQINKFLRRKFSVVGWSLTVYDLILTALVYAAVAAAGARQYLGAGEVDLDALNGNAWGYLLAIGAGVVILHSWKGPDYWRSQVLVKQNPMRPSAFFALVTLTVGAQMVSSVWITLVETVMNCFGGSVMPMLEGISGASETVSLFLYSAVFGPLAEEILFRGFVFRSLRPYGKRFAITMSALLFGLFHGNILQAPYAFLMGLLLGYVTEEYSIRWSVAVHMFNNLVLADLFPRITQGLSDQAYYMVDGIVFGGFALASLVLLIANQQKIRAYREGEWMDRRCVKCFFTSAGVIVLLALMGLNMLELFFW